MQGSVVRFDVGTVIWLLIISFVAMLVARRARLPYTVTLVIAGLLVGVLHVLEAFHLSYGLVFAVFLPPLLFDAAIRLPVELLKRNWKPVFVLAVPGVVLSTLLVGYATHYWVGLSIPLALLFGSLISATDPISVIALFRSMKVDRRLSIIMEGESLFNDGTAAVLYASLIAAVTAGLAIDARAIGIDFMRSIVGGVILGAGIGYGISLIMSRINDHLIEITLTTVAAYGPSLFAEVLGTSGVIAVISSGVVLGYYRGEAVMSATTQAAVYSFWEYVSFAINSILFLLIGIDVTATRMTPNIIPMIVAIIAVGVTRALVVYLTGALFALSKPLNRIPLSWQHVLNWGGLRGALAIALALGIPRSVDGRDTLLAMTYAVVLWTLLPQGLSIGWLLSKLGLAAGRVISDEYESLITNLAANRAGLAELDKLRDNNMISQRVYSEMAERLRTRMAEMEKRIDQLEEQSSDLLDEQRHRARMRILAAEQNAIRQAADLGLASEDTARDLISKKYEHYAEFVDE